MVNEMAKTKSSVRGKQAKKIVVVKPHTKKKRNKGFWLPSLNTKLKRKSTMYTTEENQERVYTNVHNVVG